MNIYTMKKMGKIIGNENNKIFLKTEKKFESIKDFITHWIIETKHKWFNDDLSIENLEIQFKRCFVS